MLSLYGIPVLITAAAWQAPSPIGKGEIANRLRGIMALRSIDFETSFEMRIYPRRLQDAAPPSDWEMLETYRYVCIGPRMRIERQVATKGTLTETRPARDVRIWNDGACWMKPTDGPEALASQLATVTIADKILAPDLNANSYAFCLMEDRFPSYDSLATLVSEGEPISTEFVGDVLIHRFVPKGAAPSGLQRVVRFRTAPHWRLLGHDIEWSNAKDVESFQKHVFQRSAFAIDEWQDVDGVPIPVRARVETTSRENVARNEGPWMVFQMFLARTDFRRRESETAGEFDAPSLVEGTRVYDERIRLSFRVGDRMIKVDGTVYELAEPIHEHPGASLASLLKTAVPQQRPPGADVPSPSQSGQSAHAAKHRWMFSALAGLGTFLIVLAGLRLFRARPSIT